MRTSPQVSFGLYALEIKHDSTPTASGLQPFSKIADLKTDNISNLPYASYEPDFWLLDGGYKFLPSDTSLVHVGMMSLAMSDSYGEFSSPPVLTITFSVAHDLDGLTLHGDQYTGDYPNHILVQYYDAGNSLIVETQYWPASLEFTTAQALTGCKKIVITFYSTSRPNRYLRLKRIDYGQLIYFTGSDIKEARIVEEVDMLSSEARFNTLELRLYSANAAFSIINPTGYYSYLQERQPITVHEIVDNQVIFMGQFYLDKWENKSETQIEFSCIDILGVLDTITYNGGLWTGVSIETLIASILDPLYVSYDLDANLLGTQIKGWLPICSCREALQQIAFAVGAYLDCSRSSSIKIYAAPDPATAPISTTITKAQKGREQSLTLKPLITGVEVTAHNYVSVTTSEQVYNGTLAVGSYTVTFSKPMHNLSVSGATIASSGVNYAVLTVASPGTVTLSGQTYLDTTQVYSVYNTGLASTIKPNILKVTNATLVNSTNGAAVTQRIYDYNQRRYLQTLKLYAGQIQPGDVVLLDTLYGRQLRAVVEKMDIDLTGGMVEKVQMSGGEG